MDRPQLFLRGEPPPLAGGRAVRVLLRRGILADALHVARLADESRHLREAAALDADVGQDRIDQRGLDAIAKRRVDHFVGRAAPAVAAGLTAVETVDLEDADALDLLHRLDALAHDALDTFEQLAPEERLARRSVSTFSASLRSLCASASTAARTRSASAAMRVSSASFSASSTSIVLRRRAISLSRTVTTRSSASVARAFAFSASACAADCSSDF